MNATRHPAPYSDRILDALLRLRAADALALEPVEDAAGVHRFRSRVGGWPLVVDLDETVLEMRAYHGGHTLATGRVSAAVMRVLADGAASGRGDGAAAGAALEDLRHLVAEWQAGNPRVFMEPPRVARHPDGWNNS